MATRGSDGGRGALPVAGRVDLLCTVTGTTRITDRFQRVHLRSPALLEAVEPHPTMWARFQFSSGSRPHPRAFTIINAHPTEGTFDIDVHLQDGPAARWAEQAVAGQHIHATLQGTGFGKPRANITRMHLVGDAASIPAMRTILDAHPGIPGTLWLEQQHESEIHIPLHTRPQDDVFRVLRGDGTQLISTVQAGLSRHKVSGSLDTEWFWIACEASANRVLTVYLRRDLGIPLSNIASHAYWSATRL